MSRRQGTPQPADLVLTVTPGTSAPEWCPACKAYTRLAGDLLLLEPGGVTTVGRYAWCQVCDDPRFPKENPRV
ncbi:hypothetical protein [Streptomyces fuscigenes]|uniref:hypothetical protein n=1 Tax=Streptomyces fuscigenes TaxID=1528880 RepID=UPI001F435889|nr:hypothetical protein [Streptomyces fuscigenes]MCF3960269.1 hypothetical protein [Streptomyces fuscigenes]